MTMRTLALFGVLLSLLTGSAFAEPHNPDFSKGNEAFVAGENASGDAARESYKLAADSYRESIDRDGDSWAAHFNLGNTLCRLGYYGEASLEFERAIAIDPLRPEATANLATARQAAGLSAGREQDWVERWALRLPMSAWMWALAVGGWAFLALFILPMLHGGHRLVTVIGALAALIFTGTAATGMLGWHLHAGWQVVSTADVALRSAPDADASSLRTLKAATNVKPLRSYGDWSFVNTEQGDSGWILSDNAQKVWNR